MLVVGDLLQLQPINGKPVFEKITNKTVSLRLGCTASPVRKYPYFVLVDRIWLPYFVRTIYGSHTLSTGTQYGLQIFGPPRTKYFVTEQVKKV